MGHVMAAQGTHPHHPKAGGTVCRFHLLKPEYIHGRVKELQKAFRSRILLCHVDVEDVVGPLAQVTRIAILNDVTLICAWSPQVPASLLLFCQLASS